MEQSELVKMMEDHEKRISNLESLFKSKPNTTKRESIKEFILSKRPEGEVQKTLVIGYYLEKYAGMTMFNVDDLEKGFMEAKEKIPENINLKVIKNIEKGHMMELSEKKDSKKAWTLTNTGEKFVEALECQDQ